MRLSAKSLPASLAFALVSNPVGANSDRTQGGLALQLLWIDATHEVHFAFPGAGHASAQALGALGVTVSWQRVAAGGELPPGLRVILLTRPPRDRLRDVMGLVRLRHTPVAEVYAYIRPVATALGLEARD